MRSDTKIEALYFHWVSHIDSKAYANNFARTTEESTSDFVNEMHLNVYFNRLVISHALLYVVIEGYKQLKLTNHEIDAILSDEDYVDNLRLLRNSLFHYQNDIRPQKLMKFIEKDDSGKWINRLDNCFEKFFIENVPILKITKEFLDDKINKKN